MATESTTTEKAAAKPAAAPKPYKDDPSKPLDEQLAAKALAESGDPEALKAAQDAAKAAAEEAAKEAEA